MKHYYTILILAVAILSCKTNNKNDISTEMVSIESGKANEFFQNYFDESVDRSPEFQTRLGIKKDQDKWDDLSEENANQELTISKNALQWMKDSINYDALDDQTKISYDLFIGKRQDEINGYKYRLYRYPVNQMFGTHTSVPNLLINMHKITSQEDAEAYISRMNGVAVLFDQQIENLTAAENAGIIPPKFVFKRVIDDCKNIIKGIPVNAKVPNTIFADFSKKLAMLEVEDDIKPALLKEAKTALVENVKPAYERLIAKLSQLESVASTDDGAWKFPDGENYYKNRLKIITTTDMTSDQIHEIGLAEVERIQGEMKEIMSKVNFEGDLQAFFKFLRDDDQFYYPNTDEGKEQYMDSATAIVDNMKGRLSELFLTEPKADMVVKRVEKFREMSAGKAFYQRPALDGSRPGTYYANLANAKNMPKFEMEALAYHEGIPGHHMQLSIAQELTEIPDFRKHARYTAYSEGWGLYCEFLPKEIGLYENPYSDYGRLAMELWRACRLVVDTGIHNKKWTREDGIAYYQNNTSGSERECVRMVERHIVMPGQATAYKIGMMKILELRENAKTQLGEKFDIREFHDVVLTNGLVPLGLLEELVQDWVSSKD
ncbi:MAG: DUF885 domain-containing protein [Reichenbachiella sp.]